MQEPFNDKYYFDGHYLSAIYHFLDGCVSDSYGSSITHHIRSIENGGVEGMNIYNPLHDYGIPRTISELNGIYTNNILLEINNYYFLNSDIIIPFDIDNHAIIFYLSKNESAYNMTIINSGHGLEHHDKHNHKGNRLHNLWKTYSFEQKDDLIKILKKLMALNLCISAPMDILELNSKNHIDIQTMITELLTGNQINIDYVYNFVKEGGKEVKNMSSIFSEEKVNSFISSVSNKKSDEKLSDYMKAFYHKNTFYIHDGNLYTEEQLSGSCAWYSLYWTVVAYLLRNTSTTARITEKLENLNTYLKAQMDTYCSDKQCMKGNNNFIKYQTIVNALNQKKITNSDNAEIFIKNVEDHIHESNPIIFSTQDARDDMSDIIRSCILSIKDMATEVRKKRPNITSLCSIQVDINANLREIMLYKENGYISYIILSNMSACKILYVMHHGKFDYDFSHNACDKDDTITYLSRSLFDLSVSESYYIENVTNRIVESNDDRMRISIFLTTEFSRCPEAGELLYIRPETIKCDPTFLRFHVLGNLSISSKKEPLGVNLPYTRSNVYADILMNDNNLSPAVFLSIADYGDTVKVERSATKILRMICEFTAKVPSHSNRIELLSYLKPDIIFGQMLPHQITVMGKTVIDDRFMIFNIIRRLFLKYNNDDEFIKEFKKINLKTDSVINNINEITSRGTKFIYNKREYDYVPKFNLTDKDFNSNKSKDFIYLNACGISEGKIFVSSYDRHNTGKILIVHDFRNMPINQTGRSYSIFELTFTIGNAIQLKIDGKNATITATKRSHPFSIFATKVGKNFFIEDKELLMLGFHADFYQRSAIDTNIYQKDMAISIRVKNNLILPYLDKDIISDLTKMYNLYGCDRLVYSNFDIINSNSDSSKPLDISDMNADNLDSFIMSSSGIIAPGYMWEAYKSSYRTIGDVYIENPPKISDLSVNVITRQVCGFNVIESKRYQRECYIRELKSLVLKIKERYTVDSSFTSDSSEIDKFKKNHPVCSFDCRNVGFMNDIKHVINRCKALIKTNQEDIDWNYNNIMEVMKNNLDKFNMILQTNILLDKMNSLNKILESCNSKVTCQELAEINNYLMMEEDHGLFDNFLYSSYEIIFGGIFRREQIDYIKDMFNTYRSGKKKVFHIMMGKGKSSVITPMLILFVANQSKKIKLIVPDHLISQTENMVCDIQLYYNIKIDIISDTNAKLLLIENDPPEDTVFIYDEFDFMFNPSKSTFNIIENNDSITPAISIDDDFYNKIFAATMRISNSMTHTEIVKLIGNYTIDCNSLWYNTLVDSIRNVDKNLLVRNIDYGLPFSLRAYTGLVVPYARKDTPLEKSHFSSNIITLCLSFMYRKNAQIAPPDILYLIEKRKFDILKESFGFRPVITRYLSMTELHNVQKEFYGIYKRLSKKNKNWILYEYGKMFKSNIKDNPHIFNCSFIDLMNAQTDWQIGYTGTTNIEIPKTHPIDSTIAKKTNGFIQEVVKDADEEISVKFALCGTYPNSINKMYIEQESPEIIYATMREEVSRVYDALIDCAAVFKNEDGEDICREISKIPHYRDKTFVYIDEYDVTFEFTGISEPVPYKRRVIDKPFYYYSQKHTVGIDFLQKTNLLGAVTIKNNNKYTEVAQGIYRLRKLNKGHIVDILYADNDIPVTDKCRLYDILKKNDNTDMLNQRSTLALQNLKYHMRLFSQFPEHRRKYLECNAKQYYQLDGISKDDLINYMIKNIDGSIRNKEEMQTKLKKTSLELFNKFTSSDTDYISNALFSANSNCTNTSQEQNRDRELDVMALNNMANRCTHIKPIYIIPGNSALMREQDKILYHIADNGDDKVYGSFDLFAAKGFYAMNFTPLMVGYYSLARLDDKKYLVINNINISLAHYTRHFPIYNYNGELINPMVDFNEPFPKKITLNLFFKFICGYPMDITPEITVQFRSLISRNNISSNFVRYCSISSFNMLGLTDDEINRITDVVSCDEYSIFSNYIQNMYNTLSKIMIESPIMTQSSYGMVIENAKSLPYNTISSCKISKVGLFPSMEINTVSLNSTIFNEYKYMPPNLKAEYIK